MPGADGRRGDERQVEVVGIGEQTAFAVRLAATVETEERLVEAAAALLIRNRQ
jgi:hypothetical protein